MLEFLLLLVSPIISQQSIRVTPDLSSLLEVHNTDVECVCIGIPDFRGPDGNWTLRAQGRERKEKVNTLTAVPTPSHMALVELQDRGILKYLVSQNCDGLHRRSGILPVSFSCFLDEI